MFIKAFFAFTLFCTMFLFTACAGSLGAGGLDERERLLADAGFAAEPKSTENQLVGRIVSLNENLDSAVVSLDYEQNVPAETILLIRKNDLAMQAIGRVRFVEKRALGIKILYGKASIGNEVILPGKKLRERTDKLLEAAESEKTEKQ